jgi:hypothetical protein
MQLDSIKQLVGGIVNSAIASRDKMSDKKRAEDRAGIQQDFAKLLDEKFAGLKPGDGDGDGKPGKGGKGKEDGELAAVRKTLDEMRRQNEEISAREKRARDRIVDNTVRQSVYDTLGQHGLDQARAKAAFAVFKLEDRLEAQVDDDSDSVAVLFREDDGTHVPMADGIKRWMKSEAAKLYLPPTGARGAGSRPGKQEPTGGPVSRDQAMANGMNYLAKALKNEGIVGYAPTDE